MTRHPSQQNYFHFRPRKTPTVEHLHGVDGVGGDTHLQADVSAHRRSQIFAHQTPPSAATRISWHYWSRIEIESGLRESADGPTGDKTMVSVSRCDRWSIEAGRGLCSPPLQTPYTAAASRTPEWRTRWPQTPGSKPSRPSPCRGQRPRGPWCSRMSSIGSVWSSTDCISTRWLVFQDRDWRPRRRGGSSTMTS